MKQMWVIMKADGTVQGWALTKEFAERVLAEGETIQCMRACNEQ